MTNLNQPTVTEADVMCARTILANPTMLAATLAISAHREAATAELREALDRLAKLTPNSANAHTAQDLCLTVRAIAESAIAKVQHVAG
ncbi:hypothetical protein CD928_05745 [Sphingopyxis sp. GW247-27LB]|nr:hypothetical protein CD928_05745 [Sphingopyxis sp. GW247-27LB]